jgi:hypothetical protein
MKDSNKIRVEDMKDYYYKKDLLVCPKCGKLSHVLIDGDYFADHSVDKIIPCIDNLKIKVKDVKFTPKAYGFTNREDEQYKALSKSEKTQIFRMVEELAEDLDFALCGTCGYDGIPIWGNIDELLDES